MAGLCAAVAAARNGTPTVLIHDRPVLGGNASSEIRMWISGAHGLDNRETGIIEEIQLENLWRNPLRNYSIWDSILYEKVFYQSNLTPLLNCSCNDIRMNGSKIEAVMGWQLTTQTQYEIKAKIFADCSGDSVLAPLSGAEFRIGREACSEFGEDIAPETADDMTMGMSCLIQAREMNSPQSFTPPTWANVYESDDDLPNRDHDLGNICNFWWMESGGTRDTIGDTESIRDELLKIAFGVWDHIKNRGDHGAANWTLDWVGFLPGKRESRRYVGDHILTQTDVRSGGQFDDIIAYGGWPMDDHHPEGIKYPGEPTIFHPAPSPFGIPFRCVYSRNISNLMFAGRNISTTHTALSSTRVMATCATLGQAVGTAGSIAVKSNLSPREVGRQKIEELQQLLMQNDCWLPEKKRKISELSLSATLNVSTGDGLALRNGMDRPDGNSLNSWLAKGGDWAEYVLAKPRQINSIRLVFDSNLNRDWLNSCCQYPLDQEKIHVPYSLVKNFAIEVPDDSGDWKTVLKITENHQRFVLLPTNVTTSKIRLRIMATWGNSEIAVFSFDIG